MNGDQCALAELPRQLRVLTYNIHHAEGVDGKVDVQRIANVVKSVTIDGGAVTVKFGNNAHSGLTDKQLTWRPMVPDDPKVPVTSWACNTKPAAKDTKLLGKNLTDIPAPNLPVECRAPATAQ